MATLAPRVPNQHQMNHDPRLVPLSTVTPQRVRWLWAKRIPLGALTVLEGDPGQGKSSVTYDLAARITRGRPMPGGEVTRPPAGVVLLQAEDDLARTVRPALEAVDADVTRVIAHDRTALTSRPLVLPDDLPVVERAARETAAKLVVIDPLGSFLGERGLSTPRVRAALDQLAALAARAELAIILVRHLNKTPTPNILRQGAGNMAILGAARSVLRVVVDPGSADPHRRVLALVKSNLARPESLAFRTRLLVRGGFGVEWLGPSPYSIEDMAALAGEHRTALQQAMEVLTALLAEGPLQARDVCRLAAAAGVAKRTLDRAKAQLGVKVTRQGNGRGASWWWSLPGGVAPALPSAVMEIASGMAGPTEPTRRIRRFDEEQAGPPRDEMW